MPNKEALSNRWIRWTGAVAAAALAVMWLTAGVWKLSDISGWQLKLTQLLVPVSLSLAGTLAVGIAEVSAGVLLLRPAWRRWGAWLSTALLAWFMVYIGLNYQTLKGEDCTCFPWLERAVGPAFFWSDAALLALSLAALAFSRPSRGIRGAGVAVAVVVAFSGVMLAVDRAGSSEHVAVEGSITVIEKPYLLEREDRIELKEGREYRLDEGRVFLFFFNPSCLHCLDAGRTMSEYTWTAEFVGLPTQDPDWGPGFVDDAGLGDVVLSPDVDSLRDTFEFEDVPYGALLVDGQVVERLVFWEEPELGETLREHAFID